MRRSKPLTTIVVLIALLTPAAGEETSAETAASSPVLEGEGVEATRLTAAFLASFPQTDMDVAFATSKGEVRGRYRGVLLWSVLERAGITEGSAHYGELRYTFLVTGRDGYRIVFGVGEIAPEFGATPIILATSVDGRPLPAADGLRLIVPGDRRGARSVRDIETIEIR